MSKLLQLHGTARRVSRWSRPAVTFAISTWFDVFPRAISLKVSATPHRDGFRGKSTSSTPHRAWRRWSRTIKVPAGCFRIVKRCRFSTNESRRPCGVCASPASPRVTDRLASIGKYPPAILRQKPSPHSAPNRPWGCIEHEQDFGNLIAHRVGAINYIIPSQERIVILFYADEYQTFNRCPNRPSLPELLRTVQATGYEQFLEIATEI